MITAPAIPLRWQRAWLIALVLFAAVLLNNSQLIFHSRQYETDDYAADSLQIIKAKHFRETVGQYSRYGFHHPGPAFLYVFAWGELLFSDTHLVPSPFNGQLMALYALSAFFFSAAIFIAGRRLRAGRFWFFSFALLFAAWHFGAVGKFYEFIPGRPGLFCLWPPCLLTFPFLCFLVAAASVASGETKDLPVMALAGCFLVHGHVSMPLFVGPLSVLAYAGLIRQTRRSEPAGARCPWQNAPRLHWLAAGLIALFLLPIVVNLVTAHPNNLQRIVDHLENGYGERKSLVQSILYFLQFGAYSAYPNHNPIPAFEDFDWAGVISFFKAHWKAYALWGFVIVLGAVLLRNKNGLKEELRFRWWLWLIILAATALSLFWGCIQEGPLFYYNSLFNFAIYYGVLLTFAATCAIWIERHISKKRAGFVLAGKIVLVAIVGLAFGQNARRFRGVVPDQAEQERFANAIEHALQLDPVQPKFLNFDWQAGGQTTRLALYLERRGYRWMVRENWPMLFGDEHIVTEGTSRENIPTTDSSFWRVVIHFNSASGASDNAAGVFPLTNDYDLIVYRGKNDQSR